MSKRCPHFFRLADGSAADCDFRVGSHGQHVSSDVDGAQIGWTKEAVFAAVHKADDFYAEEQERLTDG